MIQNFMGMETALVASLENMNGRLAEALRSESGEDLHAIIHEMKGVVCYFGISELSHTVIEAERLVAADARSEAAGLCLCRLEMQVADFAAAYSGRKQQADASH